ncbi:MAG: hypothetical protein AB1468_05055 [Candidatus Micrarchaeota archaeon]
MGAKNKTNTRAQAALELIVFFALAMLVFTVFVGYLLPRTTNDIKQQQWLLAMETARSFADEINLAVGVGDGYWRNFTFSRLIDNRLQYNITIRRGFVELEYNTTSESFAYTAPTLTQNVTGLGSGGVSRVDVTKGFLVINNTGGVIYLSQ